MKKNNNTMSKKFYTHDEILNKFIGEKETPARIEFDMNVELFLVGRKIKELREAKKMTQEDLGKLIGVQKAQISKIENGNNLTISTIAKVFKALGLNLKLQIEDNNMTVKTC